MNFKTIGLNVATVAAAGLAMSVTPAEAATLGPGGFRISGGSSLVINGNSSATLNFNPMQLAGRNGAFSTSLGGNPVVGSLQLSGDIFANNTTLSFGAVPSFISGLTQTDQNGNNVNVFFDLDAGSLAGNINSETDYSLANSLLLTGTLKDASNNSALGTVTLNAFEFLGSSVNISVVTGQSRVIPTPALLPGLIGLGIGAIRRRNSKTGQAN